MKNWDVIIVGAGIIGLSLSIELRKQHARVLIIERGEPGREASYAAAGMLADCECEASSPLKPLASASALMYPAFVRELQDESGIDCDLRDQGTLQISFDSHEGAYLRFAEGEPLTAEDVERLEPDLCTPGQKATYLYLRERSVDPRALTSAALKVANHREVVIVSGSKAMELSLADGRVTGVRAEKTSYGAPAVVNCAGAWAMQFGPQQFPVRPVKGQILSVSRPPKICHVIRSHDVYLVPRSDGRLLIGSTLEEAGYDKHTDPDTIRRLHDAATDLVPALKQSRILEAWAGLRPGTSDNLPILGATSIPGYFVATGHFRDGILLAPITARLMSQTIRRDVADLDISAFSPSRFSKPS